MRFANNDGWQIHLSADGYLTLFALWLRDVERIDVPASPLVPGPLDVDELPDRSGEPHDPALGPQWLAWWESLVDRRPRPPMSPPDESVEPAVDTPDPLGLARLPAARAQVTTWWPRFQQWRAARTGHRITGRGGPRHDDGAVVRAVEAALGRRARPFRLDLTLLPVRDDRILRAEPNHYLVPERVYAGPDWSGWLRSTVERIA